MMHHYDSPSFTWVHQRAPINDQITILVQPQLYPEFTTTKYFFHFKDLERNNKHLKIFFEPYCSNNGIEKRLMLLVHQTLQKDTPIPQFILIYQSSRNGFHPEHIRILENTCYDILAK